MRPRRQAEANQKAVAAANAERSQQQASRRGAIRTGDCLGRWRNKQQAAVEVQQKAAEEAAFEEGAAEEAAAKKAAEKKHPRSSAWTSLREAQYRPVNGMNRKCARAWIAWLLPPWRCGRSFRSDSCPYSIRATACNWCYAKAMPRAVDAGVRC